MKLTRNSYKRKIVLVGIIMFLAIALVSTGFAAWIMSTNAENNENGGVEMGAVAESKLAFADLALSSRDFLFEPLENDNSGVKWDGVHSENLSITITGKVSPVETLRDITVFLEIPQGVRNAATSGYIVLPECATEIVTISKNEMKLSSDGQYYEFEYTIKFQWGEMFKGQNPSKYYDEDEDGMKVDRDEVISILKQMRSTIYGKPEEEIDLGKDKLKFTINLTARSN